MQAVLGRQKGVMVPGVPSVNQGNWGREHGIFPSRMLSYGELRNLQKHGLWRKSSQKLRLIRSSHIRRRRSFSERVGPRIIWLESSCQVSKVMLYSRDTMKWAVYKLDRTKKTLTKATTNTDLKTLRRVPQMLKKKTRIVVNRTSKIKQTTSTAFTNGGQT